MKAKLLLAVLVASLLSGCCSCLSDESTDLAVKADRAARTGWKGGEKKSGGH